MRAVEDAVAKVRDNPEAYALYLSLLSEVNMLPFEQSKSVIDRSGTLIKEALEAVTSRGKDKLKRLYDQLKVSLINVPTNHAAVFLMRMRSDAVFLSQDQI